MKKKTGTFPCMVSIMWIIHTHAIRRSQDVCVYTRTIYPFQDKMILITALADYIDEKKGGLLFIMDRHDVMNRMTCVFVIRTCC